MSKHVFDMSVCVQVSKARKLLPNEIREEVLKLVELHYEDAPVETLTMGTIASSNKMMGVIGLRKLKGAIHRLEKMKTDQPNLADVTIMTPTAKEVPFIRRPRK